MSPLQIGSFQIRRPLPGARSTFLADRDGELFALKTHFGAVLDENWRSLSETLGQTAPTSERICTLREVGVSQELVYAAAPYLDGYNVHQLIKAVGNTREVSQSIEHVRAVCWLVAQFARAADERTFSSFNPSLFDDEGVAPEELFVTQSGQVMILDPRWTGLRRLTSGPETHTLAHMVAYAMPASWREGNVQVRTMVFALGTVLWELLAGYRLFRRESLVATLYRLSEHSVPELSEINPYVPAELSQFVGESLARPVESSLLEFAASLENISGLDAVSGPDAVRDLVDDAFPAKLIEEEDEAAELDLFLEQQGKRWSYVEESTTFVSAPPSSTRKEGAFELAWIADENDIQLPPSTVRFAARRAAPALEVDRRSLRVPSALNSFVVGGVMCAVVLLALRALGLAPPPISTVFSEISGAGNPRSLPGERVSLRPDGGSAPLKWLAPAVSVYSPASIFPLAEIDRASGDLRGASLSDESAPPQAKSGGLKLHPPQARPVNNEQSAPAEVRPGDLLLILPPGMSAHLGEKTLGSGRLKTQLAPGSYLLHLRSKEGYVSTLQTHIRPGALNIVEVPSPKTFTQR